MSEVNDEIMTPNEVAKIFRVDTKTVNRWTTAGKIPHFKTVGGHRRFYKSEVMALIEAHRVDVSAPTEDESRED